MNYWLIITEGSTEKALLDVLLNKGLLRFEKTELIYHQIFHARQLDQAMIQRIRNTGHGNTVSILRLGDKLSDKLKLKSKELESGKITEIIKVCIKPEFEILMILNEGLYGEYFKKKSKMHPCEFYQSKNPKYRKQPEYVTKYFESMTKEEILALINIYDQKRKKTHSRDENTLSYIVVRH